MNFISKAKSINPTTRYNASCYALVIVGFVVLQLLYSGGQLNASLRGQLIPICVYVVMALSLNLTVGVMGGLSLGHAGFMSVGAFSGAVACVALESMIPIPFLRLAAGMLVGAVFAGFVSFLVGFVVLRLKGDYLAVVTLAFGEIMRNLITCLYVGIDANGLHIGFLTSISALNMGEGARTIIDGPMGLRGLDRISTFAMGFVLIMITLFIVFNFMNSRAGRAVMALRDDYIAAESVGIPYTKYKLIAFITSAALAGAAGCLFAMNYTTMAASKFDFSTSILVLLFVVLGGLGKMRGTIIAAALLTVLPELLREFNDYRMLIYAIVLILVMLITNNNTIRAVISKPKEALMSLINKNRKGARIQ